MSAPCVPEHDPAEAERLFTFEALERSYRECRRRKRGTRNALRFEQDLEANHLELAGDLQSGRYRPRRSVCFVTLKPKCREISAADFRDRVVHHLLVGLLEPIWESVFIHDSYASRKGKGTHAAVERLKTFIPKVTRNHTVRAWYAHLDVRSFFASIDHGRLLEHLARRSPSPTVQWLCERMVRRDIASDAVRRGPKHLFDRVPPGKSLLRAPVGRGLPIGKHTSQFFANVYLNCLDQFVKHELRARYYIRYVDDLILLSPRREELVGWQAAIEGFLRKKLLLDLNGSRSRIAPLSSGVDFLGYVVHPHHVLLRRRVVVDRPAVGAQAGAQVPVAELVEHPAPLRRQGREALKHLHLRRLRIEPEEVPRVPVDAVDRPVSGKFQSQILNHPRLSGRFLP